MNIKTLLLSAALGVTVSAAQAGELYTPTQYEAPASAAAPTMTAAQAKQNVLRARARGDFDHNDFAVPAVPSAPFGRTRADVKAEVLAASRTGGLEHNDIDLPAVAKGSVLTREEVRQDTLAARASRVDASTRNTIEY